MLLDPLGMLSMGALGYLADMVKAAYVFIGSGAAQLVVVFVGRFLPVYNRIKEDPPPTV